MFFQNSHLKRKKFSFKKKGEENEIIGVYEIKYVTQIPFGEYKLEIEFTDASYIDFVNMSITIK